jgi:putative SOS response-associated peptidase YedK
MVAERHHDSPRSAAAANRKKTAPNVNPGPGWIRQNMGAGRLDQRHQRRRRRAHPVSQRRHIEIDASPFGIGGLWENWKDPISGEWIRTFAIITTDANELVAEIHDRMPLILAPTDYVRWLGDEPDPGDLMRPFPAEPMRMWPISTRVNKPENDDPSIVEPIAIATSTA